MKRVHLVTVLLGCFLATCLSATSIQKFTFEELVDKSQLIVEAEVVSVSSLTKDNLVYTRVLMEIHDVLKGDDPGEFIELDFLGGEVNGNTIIVSGQDIPLAGERGFYFIEDISGKSVNPLLGWSQGHFRILVDAKGNERLETDVQQELLEITTNKNAVLAAKLKSMKFNSELVVDAEFSPVTPDELRDAVGAFLD